ncbi:MAG: 2-amino-4-hydroxy-6-hydroxymethyldihydropteridine diphosphokinase [Pseudomonadota bacterium]
MGRTSYLVALGSNRRGHHGAPGDEVHAAIDAIGASRRCSPILSTPPLGPSIRRFANAAAWIESDESPPELLARLKRIERAFGRRRGQRWGARVIDIDIILWSGGCWASTGLVVPHPRFRERDFVLTPASAIAPDWRDPVSGRSLRQLAARLAKPRKVDRRARAA